MRRATAPDDLGPWAVVRDPRDEPVRNDMETPAFSQLTETLFPRGEKPDTGQTLGKEVRRRQVSWAGLPASLFHPGGELVENTCVREPGRRASRVSNQGQGRCKAGPQCFHQAWFCLTPVTHTSARDAMPGLSPLPCGKEQLISSWAVGCLVMGCGRAERV